MKHTLDTESTHKLDSLQQEYLNRTVDLIQEMEDLAVILDGLEDLELIKIHLKRIEELESAIEESYHIACDIGALMR